MLQKSPLFLLFPGFDKTGKMTSDSEESPYLNNILSKNSTQNPTKLERHVSEDNKEKQDSKDSRESKENKAADGRRKTTLLAANKEPTFYIGGGNGVTL